jgi:hypothetical protein
MKKIFFLLTISLACITTHAQQIDKKLLYGKWDLYAMHIQGYNLCRDSLAQNMGALIQALKTEDSTVHFTPDDSLKLVDNFKTIFDDFFETYMTFDKKGGSTVLAGFEKNKNGKSTEEKGTYKWTGENKFIQKIGKSHSEEFTVVKLTATKLTIAADTDKGNDYAEMTFTRAK